VSIPTISRFWAWPWELAARGILGINARNLALIMELNPRDCYPRLDDKIVTKRICQEHGIPVPQTLAVVERFGDIKHLEVATAGHHEFVVKPARGAAGRGIIVIMGKDGDAFLTASSERLPATELHYHVATILSGLYSLGGEPDCAIVEERVRRHPVFNGLSALGTPDIRVIVHRGQAIMAMIRLPTRQSRGRANLHQGALGLGIDVETGRTTGAVHHNKSVDRHPDTGEPITSLEIPGWSDLVAVAGRLSHALAAGYAGVDVMLDADRGPLLLEANARPGLAVQICSRTGLWQALCATTDQGLPRVPVVWPS